MPTADRVLPWRRSASVPAVEVGPLVQIFRTRHPKASTSLIIRAYEVAAAAHQGQRRKSGEAYITHPLAVATIVAELGLDDVTVAAALLHDAVEDTRSTLEELTAEFGAEVALLVDGVTKLERIEFDTKEQQQAATMRKMLLAMAKDLRVVIIKLADRLHNMRTLAAMPEHRQRSIAQETIDVYGPLAHRLGMQDLKQQLEDLAFATLRPAVYAEIDHMVSQRAPGRDIYLFQVLGHVRERLTELGIKAEVTGRPKHLWSIYEKMMLKGRGFDEIYDLVGIRVQVDSVKDCYAALGSIHATWKPVQGRFKDYIAQPKFNLYQSLHTTVIGPQGKPVEVQIRTTEMQQRAEFGVAAHWSYKGSGDDMVWLNRIVDWQAEVSDPEAFYKLLKVDLEQDEVFVFTPKGRVVALARGANPIDFAYAIHTEVGHSCVGARINGRLVPLDHPLESGDSCEIITSRSEGAGPKQDWLQLVQTPRAANKIRQWFSRERRSDAREVGRDELVKALRKAGLPVHPPAQIVDRVVTAMNYVDVDSLHVAIGENHVTATSVAERIGRELHSGDPEHDEQLPAPRAGGRRRNSRPTGVRVEGLDDVLVRLSRCCTPVPGDEIMGFVTRGRGVSVHRADCAQAESLSNGHTDRLIEVEWDDSRAGSFVASIEVRALDRRGLLSDVSSALFTHHVNILASESRTGDDLVTRMRFDFELGDASHLGDILRRLRGLESVIDAHRIVPQRSGV